jgi:hypothetical protein
VIKNVTQPRTPSRPFAVARASARNGPELISLAFAHPLFPSNKNSSSGAAVARRHVGSVMPFYFFRIRNGRYSGASERGTECADRNAAWRALTSTCADMAAGISRKLKQNSEWQMELLDEEKRPVFRIRIVAESLDDQADSPSFVHSAAAEH